MKRPNPLVMIMLMIPSLAFTQEKCDVSEQIIGSIGNQSLNVLYRGFDNRITAAASGLSDDFEVVCDSCDSIKKTEEPGVYMVRVSENTTFVTITIKDRNIKASKKNTSLTQVFRVLPLPRPYTYFKHLGPSVSGITKADLSKGELINDFYQSPLILDTKVVQFTVTFTKEGKFQSFTYQGNSIQDFSEVLRYAEIGGTITIKQNGLYSHFDFVGNKFPNTIEIQEMLTPGATILIDIRVLFGGKPITPAPVLWMVQ